MSPGTDTISFDQSGGLFDGSTANSDEGRFEKENRAFFTRVHDAYLAIAKREPERVAVIDARGTRDRTHAKILQTVLAKISAETGSRKAQNAR